MTKKTITTPEELEAAWDAVERHVNGERHPAFRNQHPFDGSPIGSLVPTLEPMTPRKPLWDSFREAFTNPKATAVLTKLEAKNRH